MRAWEIVLLAVGSPLWIVLLAALFVQLRVLRLELLPELGVVDHVP